jgi:hypothetical protein
MEWSFPSATLQSGANLPHPLRQKARGSMRGSHHLELPIEPPDICHFGVKGSMSAYPAGSEDDRLSFFGFIYELFFHFLHQVRYRFGD